MIQKWFWSVFVHNEALFCLSCISLSGKSSWPSLFSLFCWKFVQFLAILSIFDILNPLTKTNLADPVSVFSMSWFATWITWWSCKRNGGRGLSLKLVYWGGTFSRELTAHRRRSWIEPAFSELLLLFFGLTALSRFVTVAGKMGLWFSFDNNF